MSPPAPALSLRVRLMRVVYRVGYHALAIVGPAMRIRGHGVKCLLTNGEQLLLVRHTYGPDVWHLPGGGMRRGEQAIAGAAREMQEELGLHGLAWRALGTATLRLQGRVVTVDCVTAEVATDAPSPHLTEIAEIGWFARSDPPASLGREDRLLLASVDGGA